MEKEQLDAKFRELRKKGNGQIEHSTATKLYLEHMKGAETQEERIKRIHEFRCGGW